MNVDDLPVMEFAFPGPLRDQLVAAVLDGTKTTTSGLVADYEYEGSPLPEPGLRQAVIDSAGHRVAVIETTAVRATASAEEHQSYRRLTGSSLRRTIPRRTPSPS